MSLSFLSITDKHITTVLNEKNILSRRDASAGVWLSLLLPGAIILSEIKYKTSLSYSVAACISSGFLAHSVLTMVNGYWQKRLNALDLALSSIISFSTFYFYLEEGIFISLLLAILSVFMYDNLIMPLMNLFPRNFTYGECTVACQALIIFIFSTMIKENSKASCYDISTTILQHGVVFIIFGSITAYYLKWFEKPKLFFALMVSSLIITLLSLYLIIQENPIKWVFLLLVQDTTTIRLVVFWLFCCFLSVLAIIYQIKTNTKATTVIRKVFHVLIVMVFLPGIILKPCLLYLASGVILMLRILKIPPLHDFLQSGFTLFADEKDEGPLALTPIYLLVGSALPLWIHPDLENAQLLPLLSGLLAIGIGDSAASACGTWVGKNHWHGSKKTKEGTAACFLSQFFVVMVLIDIGYVPRNSLLKPTFAVALSSIVEAQTDQIDNLALPLLMYLIML